ncbi:hypothetical protein OSL00_24675, partial [Escherichia coli]
SLKTSIKTITYLSDTGCLEIQGGSLTTNRSASNLWESPATIQVIDQQTLQNSTNAVNDG